MKHILFIVSNGPYLVNFRLSLIKKLVSLGYRVSVASPKNKFSEILQKELLDLKVNIIILNLSRTSLNFLKDIVSIVNIYKIVKATNPDTIISNSAKPVIYTGLVLNIFKNISYYPIITGIGYGLYEKKSIGHKILKNLMIKLYYFSLKNSKKVIFQNKDNKELFYRLKLIKEKKISEVVNGSGIDLSLYPFSVVPKKPVFLMIARLLRDKGVREYVEAAKIVLSNFPHATFQLAGGTDENPSSITLKELQSWINKTKINYLGEKKSVQTILKNCKYFVLPSYYEGTPRSTLEALSTGRPVITTDVPGCRETVIHEKNGLIVSSRDVVGLANAMIRLLNEKEKNIKKMGKESYLIAKNKYEISKVNQRMINIMNL